MRRGTFLKKYGFFAPLILIIISLVCFQNCSKGTSSPRSPEDNSLGCTTIQCKAAKFSLLVADLDGSNVSLVKTSRFQDMTHPRVSPDKKWIVYTTYNALDSNKCASLTIGYLDTELRAIQLTGAGDKSVIGPNPDKFNTNAYWLGATNEFTYLSGAPPALEFYRAKVDSAMNLIGVPIQIPVPATIVAMDPAPHLATNKIAFPGLYNPGGGYLKSIFMMDLSTGGGLVGLSVGRDRSGAPIICEEGCTNIMENDPKFSPDGTRVAFMRQAPIPGPNGFGWHIFVVPVASPQTEVDISYAHLGADLFKNEALPEWIDNNTLVFSTVELQPGAESIKQIYTMKADGTQRTKVVLPEGFRYADVFPFTDDQGKKRLVISAEKINAVCEP